MCDDGLVIGILFELVIGMLFEGGLDIASNSWDKRRGINRPKGADPKQRTFRAKLVLGGFGGFWWGFYIGTVGRAEWPRTTLSFAMIGTVALAFYLAEFSNSSFVERVKNQPLRELLTVTPQRSLDWAKLSFLIAATIAIGFFLGGL